ncbi:unnamed protein product [Cyprideis torosa]|uniref:Uncharacterized protein n=1 Tax=Cyprideis torosa TaxID=163714 RepID=A0A7R8WQH6_9CRUS|nr:unnamed protein product [Cyprideis torosa]CAG0907969.1 unnamed protein product [Cyprideis torosa]
MPTSLNDWLRILENRMLYLSSEAAEQVRLSAKEGKCEGLPLRVAALVQEDGSFHYAIGFEDTPKDEDVRFSDKGVDLIVAPASAGNTGRSMYPFEEIDPATLASWLEKGESVRLIDVRSPAEYAQGIIEGGELMPLHLIPLQMPEAKEGEKLVIYCRTGMRSGQACGFLSQQGKDGALNLRGGIVAWAQQGLPISRADKDVSVG